MTGKLCTGAAQNNIGAGHLRSSKAFCEGLHHRAQGTALAYPVTDNPHVTGSEASDAWILGWTVADDAALGTVSKSAAPCCSVPQNTIEA